MPAARKLKRDASGRFVARARKQHSRVQAEIAAQSSFGGFGVTPYFDLDTFQQTIERSVWQYAAVYRLSGVLAAAEWKINQRGTTEEAKGPKVEALRKVLQQPNPDHSWYDLIFSAFVHLCLDGEIYLEKARNRFGAVAALYSLNSKPVRPIPDTSGKRLVSSYEIDIGGTVIRLQPEDVVAVREYNPKAPHRGFAATAPLRREIAADIEAAKYNLSLMQRGGKTGGIVSPVEGDIWTEDQVRRIRQEFENWYGGSGNAGRVVISDGTIKWDPNGTTPKDMDFVQLRKFAREAVSAAYGVPPLLIQSYDSATYANATQQVESFYDHTGRPKLKQLHGGLNQQLVWPDFGDDIELAPDWVGISNQIQDETTRTATARDWWLNGMATLNECRAKIGLPSVGPKGDVFFVPLNGEIREPDKIAIALTPPATPASEPSAPDSSASPAETRGLLPAPGGRLAAYFGGNGHHNGNGSARKAASGRRAAIATAHVRALRAAERKLEARVRGYLLDEQADLMRHAKRCASPADIEGCLGSDRDRERKAFDALAPAILETIRDSGDLHLDRLGIEKRGDGYARKSGSPSEDPNIARLLLAFDLENSRVRGYLDDVFFRQVKGITGATLEDLRAEVREGLEKGEGVSEIVLRIAKMPAFGTDRAERIARTETIGAFNLGAAEAFRAAGTPRKSWLSTRDDVVRVSHERADQETSAKPISVDSKFHLIEPDRGEADIDYPGDPSAPAWATVGCRCALVPEQAEQLAYYAERCKEENGALSHG